MKLSTIMSYINIIICLVLLALSICRLFPGLLALGYTAGLLAGGAPFAVRQIEEVEIKNTQTDEPASDQTNEQKSH